MSERKYEHAVDLDDIVATAAQYEKVITEAQEVIFATDNEETIRVGNLAADALELQHRMFFKLLPEDVREEFWEKLEEAVKQPAGA